MPDAAQYTLGLFDSTALGWTLDTPKAEAAEQLHHDDTGAVPVSPSVATSIPGTNFYLDSDRALARGWPARARDNIAAIRLSKELEESGRAASADEQAQLLRFIGFGATDLAQNCFPLPGEDGFRPGWEEIGGDLASVTTPAEYAALQRATQYAHYTPEPVIRSLWRAAQHLGFDGGRVLEPGMGTGLFFALLPEALRDSHPPDRRRIRPHHRPYRRPDPSRGPRALRGLHPQHPRRGLRPRDRQPALRGPHRPRRPVDRRPWSAPARLLHRPLHQPAAARRHRPVRHQHRDDGQGDHDRPRAYRQHG